MLSDITSKAIIERVPHEQGALSNTVGKVPTEEGEAKLLAMRKAREDIVVCQAIRRLAMRYQALTGEVDQCRGSSYV